MNENLNETINELKSEIDSLRPLDKETENRIQQKFRLDWNYHSNNIEGNSLTFGETKSFLLHGITADGKPLKDHLDIKGHNEVLLLLQDVIKDERPLTENFIREIHQTILHEPYEKVAETSEGIKTTRRINIGKYKTQPNHVKTQTGEMFYFASPEETPAKMNDLMNWYKNSIGKKSLHPAELAALFHYKFIRIHPFDDGNGRLARILMNLTLMKFGFPPVIIKTQKKDEYYRALQQADGGNENYFVDYIAQLQINSLQLYLRGAKGENIEEDNDIDKEIALFKATIKNDPIVNSFRSIENQKARFNDSISPLIIVLYNKLNTFRELFTSMSCSYTTSNNGFNFEQLIMEPIGEITNIENFIIALQSRFNNDLTISHFELIFSFRDLLKSSKDSTFLNYTISFKFNKGNYQLRYDGSKESFINKTYLEKITQQEISDIVSNSVRDIMKNIEKL